MAACDCLQDRSVIWLCGGIQSRPRGDWLGVPDPIGAPLAGGGSLGGARCAPATCCNRRTRAFKSPARWCPTPGYPLRALRTPDRTLTRRAVRPSPSFVRSSVWARFHFGNASWRLCLPARVISITLVLRSSPSDSTTRPLRERGFKFLANPLRSIPSMLARSVNELGPFCARTARMLNWAALKPTGRRKSSKCRLTSRDVLRTWKFRQARVSSSRTVMALNQNDRECVLRKPSAFVARDNLRRSWASRSTQLAEGTMWNTTGICAFFQPSHMGTPAWSAASGIVAGSPTGRGRGTSTVPATST
jgi:hypothetical protein